MDGSFERARARMLACSLAPYLFINESIWYFELGNLLLNCPREEQARAERGASPSPLREYIGD